MAINLGKLRRSGLTQSLDICLSVSKLDEAARNIKNPLSQGHLVQIFYYIIVHINFTNNDIHILKNQQCEQQK